MRILFLYVKKDHYKAANVSWACRKQQYYLCNFKRYNLVHCKGISLKCAQNNDVALWTVREGGRGQAMLLCWAFAFSPSAASISQSRGCSLWGEVGKVTWPPALADIAQLAQLMNCHRMTNSICNGHSNCWGISSRLISKRSWLLECSLPWQWDLLARHWYLSHVTCQSTILPWWKQCPAHRARLEFKHFSILWVLRGLSAPCWLWHQRPKGSRATALQLPTMPSDCGRANPGSGRAPRNDVQPHLLRLRGPCMCLTNFWAKCDAPM